MRSMETQLATPQGEFVLKRLPERRRELLRAWDAADEYLLNRLAETGQPAPGSRVLIINDAFGALAVALHASRPQALSDSWLSQAATRLNLSLNHLPADAVQLSSSVEPLQGPFDLVLVKVPKTLALLEDELIRLRPQLAADARVILGGMVKAMPKTLWGLVERILGPTTTALAWKKAKLIFASPDPALPIPASPYPTCYPLEGTRYRLCNHANVFSRDGLDIGTRFFLQHLPPQTGARDIIDLGCGNGVVGLLAAEQQPEACVHFVDESFMAVASAEDNFRRAFGDGRAATFTVGDGLAGFAPGSADLILCNPPFHQQHAVGDQIATAMFRQSRKVLKRGGELWVVGNRHLGYHQALKQIFGNASLVASNPKFVILKAVA